jgi:hypothetical protein
MKMDLLYGPYLFTFFLMKANQPRSRLMALTLQIQFPILTNPFLGVKS